MTKQSEKIWLGLGGLITGGVGYGLYPYVADFVKDAVEYTTWLDIKPLLPIVYGVVVGGIVLFYFVKPLLEKIT